MDPVTIISVVAAAATLLEQLGSMAVTLMSTNREAGFEMHAMSDELKSLIGVLESLQKQELPTNQKEDLNLLLARCAGVLDDLKKLKAEYYGNSIAWMTKGKAKITSLRKRLESCTNSATLQLQVHMMNSHPRHSHTEGEATDTPDGTYVRDVCPSDHITHASTAKNTMVGNGENDTGSGVICTASSSPSHSSCLQEALFFREVKSIDSATAIIDNCQEIENELVGLENDHATLLAQNPSMVDSVNAAAIALRAALDKVKPVLGPYTTESGRDTAKRMMKSIRWSLQQQRIFRRHLPELHEKVRNVAQHICILKKLAEDAKLLARAAAMQRQKEEEDKNEEEGFRRLTAAMGH